MRLFDYSVAGLAERAARGDLYYSLMFPVIRIGLRSMYGVPSRGALRRRYLIQITLGPVAWEGGQASFVSYM